MAIWNNQLIPSRRKERGLTTFSDIDDMFDRFRREFLSPDIFTASNEGFSPKIEVRENAKNIFVSAELPGMKEKDINVTLRDNNLIIEGEKESESKKDGKDFYSSEFFYGSFYRSIPLLADVDADKVEAKYKNGVLEIQLSKLEESMQKTKKIEIKH